MSLESEVIMAGGLHESPIIRIAPRYCRPTEFDTLLGDRYKAEQKIIPYSCRTASV